MSINEEVFMDEALFTLSKTENEPVLDYKSGSPEKLELKKKLKEFSENQIEIPLIIGGKEIYTKNKGTCVMPHKHEHILGTYSQAGPEEVKLAIQASQKAWKEWSSSPWPERVSVFLKAAELLSSHWRQSMNAATILSQSKTVFQSEIDSACELIDFFRFNSHFVDRIYPETPKIAYTKTDDIRNNYIEILNMLLSNEAYVGIATHDMKLINLIRDEIALHSWDPHRFEFQALFGVSSQDQLLSLLKDGYRVRLYLPFGNDWYAYSLRRCKESPQLTNRIAFNHLYNNITTFPLFHPFSRKA